MPPFYFRNASLFVLPLLAIYFLWKRGSDVATGLWLALPFTAAAVFANVYPFHNGAQLDNFPGGSDTQLLTVLHLPIALWLLAVGVAYVGGRWFTSGRRMDFVRFSGELAIYYVLIALGGGVVTGFTVMLFSAIDMEAGWFVGPWLIPCGAAGAVIIGSWLVEAKQSVIENMAPVLTRLFTPLFAVMLATFLGTMLLTGRGVGIQREVLIGHEAVSNRTMLDLHRPLDLLRAVHPTARMPLFMFRILFVDLQVVLADIEQFGSQEHVPDAFQLADRSP